MEDKKRISSWGTVFSAVFLAMLILGLCVFSLFFWVVPYFKINSAQIFNFCILILPFVIGIIMVLIGVSLRIRKQREFDEALMDRISAGNLFAMPDEEPSANKASGKAKLTPAEEEEKAAFDSVSSQVFNDAQEEDDEHHPLADLRVTDSLEDLDNQLSKQLESIIAKDGTAEAEPINPVFDDISDILDQLDHEENDSNQLHPDETPLVAEEPSENALALEDAASAESAGPEQAVAAEAESIPDDSVDTSQDVVDTLPSMMDSFEADQPSSVNEEAEPDYQSILDDNDPVIRDIDSVILSDNDSFQATDDVEPVDDKDYMSCLEDELDSAERIGYEISFAVIYDADSNEVEPMLAGHGQSFSISDGNLFLIIPFFNSEEAESILKNTGHNYKLSSRNGRTIGSQAVTRELGIA